MKKISSILAVFLLGICAEGEVYSQEAENMSYTDYTELEDFKDYEKVTDTSFTTSGKESTHRVTELRKGETTVILFSEISLDDRLNEHYRLLDTLKIAQPEEPYYVSIGYCYRDDLHEEQVVAIVERTEDLHIKNLIRAWKADTASQQFEELSDIEGIDCLNEFSK